MPTHTIETQTPAWAPTQALRREMAAKTADEAVTVALACLEAAGWRDLAIDLVRIKAQTASRRRAVERG